jgi:hypothetical protein
MKEVQKFLFDEKKFVLGHEHSNYSLNYELLRSDVDTSEMAEKDVEKLCKMIEKRTDQACFSNFRDCYAAYLKRAKVKPNRIRFFCEPNKHSASATHLSKEEIKRWIKVCKKNNLMPSNVDKNFINNGIYDIHFEGLSMEMCYVYLCAGRYVQEEPFFVRGVLHLIDDHKIGFFTAFCLASYYQTTNSGHHILPLSRDYKISQMPKTLNDPKKDGFGNTFNLIDAAKLSNFVHDGDKGKPIKDMDVPLKHVNLHGELTKCWTNTKKARIYTVDREHLRSVHLEAVIKSGEFDKPLSV